MANKFELMSEGELRSLVTGAAERAAKKIQKDLLAQARKNVQAYYDQYDPDVYVRTFNLRDHVNHIPILQNNSSGNSISFTVGFEYDGSQMRDYPDGGDSAWVFENFLEGVHPRTSKGREYFPIKDISQNQLMDEWVDANINNKISKYMQTEIISAFSKLL